MSLIKSHGCHGVYRLGNVVCLHICKASDVRPIGCSLGLSSFERGPQISLVGRGVDQGMLFKVKCLKAGMSVPAGHRLTSIRSTSAIL
jgi:hypothetical protein